MHLSSISASPGSWESLSGGWASGPWMHPIKSAWLTQRDSLRPGLCCSHCWSQYLATPAHGHHVLHSGSRTQFNPGLRTQPFSGLMPSGLCSLQCLRHSEIPSVLHKVSWLKDLLFEFQGGRMKSATTWESDRPRFKSQLPHVLAARCYLC